MWKNIFKNFILDIFFPAFCLNCHKEGDYLCPDCFSLIDIFEEQYDYRFFYAVSYDDHLVKKLLNQFKYQPWVRELAKPLTSLIITYLLNLNKVKDFQDFIIVPVPLRKNKLKKRGFNQSAEIARELSKSLKIPVQDNLLIKIKKTPAQVELKKEERERNLKDAFFCPKPELVRDKKILLIDDVITTGSTMREASTTLRSAGAGQVQCLALAKGE